MRRAMLAQGDSGLNQQNSCAPPTASHEKSHLLSAGPRAALPSGVVVAGVAWLTGKCTLVASRCARTVPTRQTFFAGSKDVISFGARDRDHAPVYGRERIRLKTLGRKHLHGRGEAP